MSKRHFQGFQGEPRQNESVYSYLDLETRRQLLRVVPDDGLNLPIFFMFLSSETKVDDDSYVYSDEDGLHWRMPRLEKE